MASTEATCAAQEEIAALGTSGCSSEVTSERTELRRVALEYLTASMLANEAARADCGEEGVAGGSSSALKHDDDELPPNLFDLDKILAKTPLLRTDNAFHDTLNSDATISCPYVLNRPGQVGEGIEAVVRFGKSTCGHPKTVHGGVTALTFDNLLGMALFLRGTGPVFTAFLKVDYKAPLPSRTTTVLDVTVDRQEGRKLFVTGRLNSLDGKMHYASAEALFVKPREKPSSRTE